MNGQKPGLVMNPSAGGPVGAPPLGQQVDFAQMQQSDGGVDTGLFLNTYIYDYFLRKENYDLARAFYNTYRCKTTPRTKQNGAMDLDKKDKRPDDLPDPDIPGVAPGDPAFLESWWQCFWDMFFVARGQKTTTMNANHQQYLLQQRARQNAGNAGMLGGARAMGQFNMVNGVMAKSMQNRNVTPQGMTAMQGKMMGQQMQRDPSNMDMNGQRPQTPGDNAPSPSKRPRLDNASFDGQAMMNRQVSANQQAGGMGATGGQPIMQNGQMAGFGPTGAAPLKMEGMNGMPPQAPMGGQALEGGDNRHALQDYQMQLMLLEQQNKKRLMQANRDRDNIAVGTNAVGTPGAGFAAPNMSPSGSRGAGPSPTPNDQMKRVGGTPKMAQQAVPGSPMPELQNRASPAPNFDPSSGQMQAGGMPQQYYANIGGNPMVRPQTSHPNFTMNMTGMNPQSMEQMRMAAANNARMPNGQPWPQGANPAMQGQQNPGMRNPQQGPGTMGPPPAPAGEQQATVQRAQPSSPAQPAAPPTPSQKSATAKGKKDAGQKKKPPAKKGSNAGATPAADGSEPPISAPSTPITPMHRETFSKAGGSQQTATAGATPTVASAQQPSMDPNSTGQGGFPGMVDDTNGYSLEFAGVDTNDVLENFDFDSFLHTDDVNTIGMEFAFDSNVADATV